MTEPTRTVTDTQRAMLAEMADAPTQRATWTADPSGYGVRGWYTVATDGHRYSTRTADALVDAGMAEYADHGATVYLTRAGADYLARWPLAEDTAERMADVAALADTLAGPNAEPTGDERGAARRRARLAAALADYHATPRAAVAEGTVAEVTAELADRLADAVRDAATWMAANLTDGQRATYTPTLGVTGAELQRRLADLAREVRR